MKIEICFFVFQFFAPILSFELFATKSTSHVASPRYHGYPTFLFAKGIEKNNIISEMSTKTTACQYCGEAFNSRNALFRHLRTSQECFLKLQSDMPDKGDLRAKESLEKQKVAIQFGYHSSIHDHHNIDVGINEFAAKAVYKAFFQAFQALYPSFPIVENEMADWTLASAAKLRHPSLDQDYLCSANMDVLGINFRGDLKGFDFFSNEGKIVDQMQNSIIQSRNNNENKSIIIQVLSLERLSVSTKFNAEKSCSQRFYQYLVPAKWLDDSEETYQWIQQTADSSSDKHRIRNSNTPQSILTFKKILKLAQSPEVTLSSSVRSSSNVFSIDNVNSSGRFGKLANKSRQPWHNFCDPSLGAMANPSNEHIWRSIDKAGLVSFILDKNNHNEPFLVTEFRGDGFTSQQVRRMIAVAIAMTRGWLPIDFFSIATRPDVTVETPIAPHGRLYLNTVRFHFVDLINAHLLFDSNNHSNSEDGQSWLNFLQNQMLHDRSKYAEDGNEWLIELKNVISPRIHEELAHIKSNDATKQIQLSKMRSKEKNEKESFENTSEFPEIPSSFKSVLLLLRNICTKNNFPPTSGARTRSMRLPQTDQSGTSSFIDSLTRQGRPSQSGSFTVVNPQTFRGKLPLANQLYPKLVDAIFALHKDITTTNVQSCLRDHIDYEDSLPSPTHCAVNRNIEYVPHIDSGKGRKLSYTTIVSLGDHSGGNLLVEGKSYSIHYKPLKYDGWKQVHSTLPFSGERFSLVWFTPEKRHTINDEKDRAFSFEDFMADTLVGVHAKKNPLYPVLKFRPNSTDSLVISEIFDEDRGCAYELDSKMWQNMVGVDECSHPNGFSVKGHKYLLDIGAHIGVFTRYALAKGCEKIYAYEPEIENQKLLKQNSMRLNSTTEELEQYVEIYSHAIAHGDPAIKKLIHARNRNDGSLNTWRHSLEEYSQYIDKEGMQSPSGGQNSILTRSEVPTRPLFGAEGALEPGITFVKMDCEGAEIDILLSPEASDSLNWLDVTNLVFEWSFTKERRISKFHEAIQNLIVAGFIVTYEGKGSWWDSPISNCILWPYHNDIVVFAMR